MNSSLFPSSASASASVFVFLLLVFIEIPSSLSNNDLYTQCSAQFVCGKITAGFPFWGNGRPPPCGRPELELRCENNNTTKIEINDVAYQVLEINQDSEILRIAREDYLVGLCPPHLVSTTFDTSVFESVTGYSNITIIYGCPAILGIPVLFNCPISGTTNKGGYILPGAMNPGECYSSVSVPVPTAFVPVPTALEPIMNLSALLENLKLGFEVKWKAECGECLRSQGVCGFDITSNQTTCYCPNQPNGSKTCVLPVPGASPPSTAPAGPSKTNRRLVIAIVIAAPVAVIVAVTVILKHFTGRLGSSSGQTVALWWKDEKQNQKLEAFMVNYQSLTPKRYSYSDVKKMTNSFSTKLGQGGFGCVYKGKLLDGRLVAVKVLTEFKTEGEEFMNEVASISRTSHVNIVTLLGFCLERNKRALIYGYMPNGSLDRFISYKGCPHANRLLEWKILHEIAVGIARGLEYLHRFCKNRVVHFDIKPHNILLDEEFCPRISDFGLAKLCKRAESKVSLTGARGTAGYIAPEVYFRNFGGVSYKSDVYSYGIMILEMVGERKRTDGGLSETSETYFPDWFYKHLEPGEISRLHEGITEENEEIARKMILVGLWCIQINPSDRPSMTKVVEMLEGSLQSMQIPPKPSFPSPERSLEELSSTSSQKNEDKKAPVDEADL